MGDAEKMWINLVECVKTRKEPYCPVRLGVRVQASLNMGIPSLRENKVMGFDRARQQIIRLSGPRRRPEYRAGAKERWEGAAVCVRGDRPYALA